MNRAPQHFIFIFAAILVIGLGLVIIGWQFARPPFNLNKLDRLREGMSQAEVSQILGKPASIYDGSWAYSRTLAWPIVYVYFDEKGRFLRHEYDY